MKNTLQTRVQSYKCMTLKITIAFSFLIMQEGVIKGLDECLHGKLAFVF